MLIIKADCILVPVEYRQFHSAAAGFLSNSGQPCEKHPSDPAAAGGRPHVEVLKVKTPMTRPRREIEEIESKPKCLRRALRHYCICDLSLIHISEPTRQAEISYAVF